MNFPTQSPPGGGAMNFSQLWHPPISAPWIVSILVLVAAVNLEALPPAIISIMTHPAGFFFTLLIALGIYDSGFPPAAFALLFFLLMAWSKKQHVEGFSPSGTVDWVTNNKRWFVEVVLKEKPLGIQEKDVKTYPIQGDNSLPSS